MWRWLDPIECRIAEQCVAQGHVLEAARVLLAGGHTEHKAVREMLGRIGPQLVEQARQAYEAGDLLVAGELIESAAKCGELPPDARTLSERLLREGDERRDADTWRRRRIATADAWAGQGRLQSALGLIEPLAADGDVTRRALDWREAAERLSRYAREFSEHLVGGEFDAAEAVLRKARDAAPGQPQVLCMEQALREARPVPQVVATKEAMNTSESTAHGGESRMILAGLASYGDILIVRQPVVTLGTAKDPHVDVPIQALLRRRHAVLMREDDRERGPQFRIVPLQGCAVAVNREPVPNGQTRRLADGDVIQLGSELCRWTFRQPVSGSGTAMLTRQRPASALVFTPDGRQIEHVVLAADELTIGREPGAAHVVDRLLPVASLRLSWRVDGLHAVADGGVLFVNDGQDHDAADAPISSPAELSLYADGPERVDHALLGTGGPDAARLQLTPWPPQGGRP